MKHKVTLIIPDIHHKWELAENIIAKVKHDDVLFLGDYFDDFGDDPAMVQDTCDWFKTSVSKPNRIHLYGNHDVHYAFAYRTFVCSGYEQWKYFIIKDSISHDTWDKVKWYHILDDTWLTSHAGLHRLNLPQTIQDLSADRPVFLNAVREHLDASIINGFRAAANNVPYWIFNAGRARGGMQRVGGIIWCDYEREFAPIKGLNQILGHTPQVHGVPNWCVRNAKGQLTHPPTYRSTPTELSIKDPNYSVNIDLDVHKNMHYAVWNGKNLVARSHKDL